jgi:hypothetical protein
MILTICSFVVLLVCFAFLWNEGMWSNALTMMNTVLAGLLATSYFEPLANWLEELLPTYTYVLDFLSLWLLFALVYSLLREFTDRLSRYRVRFKKPVETAGSAVFALGTGWVLLCFAMMTLHTAPLARTPLRGSFQSAPMSNNFLGLAPDRLWLGFVQKCSLGSLSLSPPRAFDPEGEFILKYGTRREQFSQEPEIRVRRD